MSSLNLEQHEPAPAKKKNNRNLKIFLGIGALIAVPVIGTTLAASITVNTGSIQFGQGISQAVACDSSVTVTPVNLFSNATTAGSFNLDTITVSGIANACNGSKFTLTAYGDSSNTPLTISSGGAITTALIFTPTISGSCTVAKQASASETDTCTYVSDSSTVQVVLGAGVTLPATSIYKFTVETS